MRKFLTVAAYLIWAPLFVGFAAKLAVDSFHGEGSFFVWLCLALFVASWLWGVAERRRRKPKAPPPSKFTIYDYEEEDDGIRFHGRYEDGTEHEFFLGRGTTGSKVSP